MQYTVRDEMRIREMPVVERAEEVLKHITPGEWDVIYAGLEMAVAQIDNNTWRKRICRMGQRGEGMGTCTREEDRQHRCNAKFIAMAPAIVRGLLDEVSKYKKEIEALKARWEFDLHYERCWEDDPNGHPGFFLLNNPCKYCQKHWENSIE